MTQRELEKRAEAAVDRVLSGAEKELVREYQKALKSVKSELSDLYEKYSSGGTLTYSEMSKYNRLKTLNKNIAAELNALGQAQDTTIKTLVGDAYQESYYRHGFAMDMGNDLDIGFGPVRRETLTSLINEPNVSGLSLKEKLSRQRYDLLIRQRKTMTQGFIKGESYVNIAKFLTKSFDISLNNAMRIARTEGARAATEGHVAAYNEAEARGVEMDRIWVASLDGRTRPTHGALDGQSADEDRMFHSQGMTAEGPGLWGDDSMDINCFPGGVYSAANAPIQKAFSRFYVGDLITIKTSGGVQITGTPNHEILTPRGWVALRLLENGMDVFCASGIVGGGFAKVPQVDDRPAMLAEIFDFSEISRAPQRKRGVTKDFHGDGFDSDVNIKDMDSHLVNGRHSELCQGVKHLALVLAHLGKRALYALRSFGAILYGPLHTTDGVMGRLTQSLSLIGGRLSHAYKHGLASISLMFARALYAVDDYCPRASEMLRKLLNRYAFAVHSDYIVSVDVDKFFGHVYNLQTANSLYLVTDKIQKNNGNVNYFICHNCRCTIRSEIKGFPPALRRYDGEVRENITYAEWKELHEKE